VQTYGKAQLKTGSFVADLYAVRNTPLCHDFILKNDQFNQDRFRTNIGKRWKQSCFEQDSNARQRSADCMADDNTAMRLGYATSSQIALQRMMMEQGLTLCGTGTLGGSGCKWVI
jgi:hypothetical protein